MPSPSLTMRYGSQDLNLKPARLVHSPTGEVSAREALGEAEVVLDAAASPGLPAGCLAFYKDRFESLGGPVDRCR